MGFKSLVEKSHTGPLSSLDVIAFDSKIGSFKAQLDSKEISMSDLSFVNLKVNDCSQVYYDSSPYTSPVKLFSDINIKIPEEYRKAQASIEEANSRINGIIEEYTIYSSAEFAESLVKLQSCLSSNANHPEA